MIIASIFFYIMAVLVVITTVLAILNRNLVHALVYLILSFAGTALIFALLGAPVLAAFEIMIYAGGILVLFLFAVITSPGSASLEDVRSYARRWLPVVVPSVLAACVAIFLIGLGKDHAQPLPAATVAPIDFGQFVFKDYWLSIEIASFLLLAALVGALLLGGGSKRSDDPPAEESS